jgi:hypothetical protein
VSTPVVLFVAQSWPETVSCSGIWCNYHLAVWSYGLCYISSLRSTQVSVQMVTSGAMSFVKVIYLVAAIGLCCWTLAYADITILSAHHFGLEMYLSSCILSIFFVDHIVFLTSVSHQTNVKIFYLSNLFHLLPISFIHLYFSQALSFSWPCRTKKKGRRYERLVFSKRTQMQ